MGNYARIRIGVYPLAATRDFVDPTAMILFSESDKCVQMPDVFVEDDDEFGEDEEHAYPEVKYVASLAVVKDRLEFMGYTLDKVREEFQSGVEELIAERTAWLEHEPSARNDIWHQSLVKTLSILKQITFEDWLEAFGFIFRGNHYPGYHHKNSGESPEENFPPLIQFLLSESPREGVWTPLYDFRSSIRAAIEITGIEPELVYDISELVDEGTIDPDSDLCEWARRQTADEFVLNHKVIVFTEGKSDKRIIEGALRLLYPHLTDYYSFMDYDAARSEGGAGALVAVIKAFVGGGIVNRTIALFDNDTAARAALRGLRTVSLPESIRVIHLPDVDWARKYPTLGPQGLIEMDVNGLAGSVELYFGSDVLRQDDGTFMPVQWRGYDTTMQAYQGEVLNKTTLQEKYSAKLDACLSNPGAIDQYDWTGMKAIVDLIRTAFHSRKPHNT